MAQQKPTAFLFLDRRRVKKNGKYPVKLIVDYREEKKIYRLPYDFSDDDWTKIHSPRLKNEELKVAKEKLSILTGIKFNSTLRKMEEQGIAFNFKKFDELYFDKTSKSKENKDVYSVFETYINELVLQGRIGTADSYRTALHALQGYRKRLRFEMISPKFLRDFESYLLHEKNITETTVGIYMRTLRVIVNHAIHNPDSPVRMEYPFSQHSLDGKYKIPTGANIKKALSFDDIERLKAYKGETESEQRALDFWLFSYYCNGINMSDLCKLRFGNIIGDQIVFTRSKTARARKNPKIIQAYLHPEMRKIIEKWGTPDRLPDNYIFPILEYNSNPEREHQIVKQFTRWVNEYLHRISRNLGFEKNISTYHARHSFATVMKRKNVNIAYISDSLGHSNLKTTENYLAGFTDETIKENSSLL